MITQTHSILAIDPGTTESAWVLYDGQRLLDKGFDANERILVRLRDDPHDHHLAIEMIASYGMPVGAETFETVLWIGRFIEAWARRARSYEKVYRMHIKDHLCHNRQAKDPHIRQAIMDRFGGRSAAMGLKRTPGPLYGVSKHLWSALAVALYAMDQRRNKVPLTPDQLRGNL